MKRYAGILFDADNTLFDYDRSESEALLETCAKLAPSAPAQLILATYRPINALYWKRFEQGLVSITELQAGRFAALLTAIGVSADVHAVSEEYLDRLSRKAYFLPDAREVVEALAAHATLGLVTNGISRVQRGRLAAAGIAPFFSAILVSEEMGCAKPDRRFFDAAVGAVGIAREGILCVGDNPSADVAGARDAGIDACWFNPSGAYWPGPGEKPMYVAKGLRDIVQYVQGVV
jgi:2-haloacid dehalogenase